MEAKVNASLVSFHGLLNEHTPMDSIRAALLSARGDDPDHPVRVDFSGVERANSCGLVRWCGMLRGLGCQVIYVNSPPWLVDQFNGIQEMLTAGASVESVLVPFFCQADNSYVLRSLVIGEDFPVLEDYGQFELTAQSTAGALEADVEPVEYFSFISRNAAAFVKKGAA